MAIFKAVEKLSFLPNYFTYSRFESLTMVLHGWALAFVVTAVAARAERIAEFSQSQFF